MATRSERTAGSGFALVMGPPVGSWRVPEAYPAGEPVLTLRRLRPPAGELTGDDRRRHRRVHAREERPRFDRRGVVLRPRGQRFGGDGAMAVRIPGDAAG